MSGRARAGPGTGRRPRAVIGVMAAVFVVLGVANVVAEEARVSWDLTASRSASLSEETLSVLGQVDRRMKVWAAFRRDDPGRVDAATLLSRYREENRRIEWEILDPRLRPGVIDRLGVERGGIAVEALEGEREVETAPFTIEIDITSAIARVLRETSGRVCFTVGHGERGVEEEGPEGLSEAAELLRSNGYEVRTVGLLAAPQVPSDCDAVVVADPTSSYEEGVLDALRAYLHRSGKALVLTDPDSTVDLSGLTRTWGITFERGIVLEADPGLRLPGDPVTPIVRRYVEGSPPVRGLGPTVFPGAQAIVVDPPEDRPGLIVDGVAETSPTAYLERDPGDGSFDPPDDLEGPVTIAAAADDSEVLRARSRSPEIRRTRIFATSDTDFASNRFVGDGANARLVLQAMDWLTQPEPLVGAVPNFPEVRELELTEARSRYVLFLTAGVVPGLFLLAGGLVWVLRRGR